LVATVMHAIHELTVAGEILDRLTIDFLWASPGAVGSRVAEGLADAAGVDSKATLERRVEK